MKNYLKSSLGLLAILVIALGNISFLVGSKIQFKEINYGPMKVQRVSSEQMKDSPSGRRGSLSNNVQFIATTDSIEAIIGQTFGCQYQVDIEGKDEVEATIIWRFPEGMKNNFNKPIEEIKYKTNIITNQPTFSAYTLEVPNEVVKGKWTYILKIGSNKLLERNFYLY